jgi:hypothetical protein
VIAALALVVAQTSAPPSPAEIFRRAQRAWLARAVPPYESFQVACERTFLAPRCDAGEVVAFTVRANDGRTYAQTVPSHGATPKILLRGGYITGPASTPLGFYRVLPNGSSPVPSPPPNLAPDPLQTIATVTASAHVYEIQLAGEENVEGRACYHLTLHPLLAPDRYPLRELWVDKTSFEVVQLTYERPYDEKHTRALVRYRFAPVGPQRVWAIVHIEAEAAIHELFSTRIDRVADDLSEITFPSSAPAWYFEPNSVVEPTSAHS